MKKASGVRWDLTDLFAGIDDPKFGECMAQATLRAEQFAKTYRGKITATDLMAPILRAAIREYEEVQKLAARPCWYAMLAFSADVSDDRIKALVA